MELLTLILAVAGLLLAAVAYWRSGGQQDVAALRQQLERELDVLRTTQKEVTASATRAVTDAYEASRLRLVHVGQRLDHLKDEAVEGLESQIEFAGKQLHSLQRRLTDGVKAVKDSTLSAAQNAERAVARQVRRLEAWTTLLYAKSKIQRAAARARKEEFDLAERRLEEAAELLRTARETLGEDHAYDASLDNVKLALRAATEAVRANAEDARRRIEHVLNETNALVASLEQTGGESTERRAA